MSGPSWVVFITENGNHTNILTMHIYGLDLTSAPSHDKPITCASGKFESGVLYVGDIENLHNFSEFEAFLNRPGPWHAGMDFPFGQPAKLIKNLAWGDSWETYVRKVGTMTMEDFVQTLDTYRSVRAKGDKQHPRAVDRKARSQSPMTLYYTPVGRMFFRAAPYLLKSGASVLPCHPTDDNRIVVEVYPALVARKWIGKRSYKTDTKAKQSAEHRAARQVIVDGICTQCQTRYGFHLNLDDSLSILVVDDPSGDQLDSVLCAIQAAWSYMQRAKGYGIPANCDPLEGWIVDPDMVDRLPG
jgi:hypothetical protein